MVREEKEVHWILNLLNSRELKNTWFKKKGGSICDFETCANNSARDNEFNKWFKMLLEKEIIKFLEFKENSKGSPTKIYTLNEDKLYDYLQEFEFYKKAKKIVIGHL
jgi:predicted transcriptional regulator